MVLMMNRSLRSRKNEFIRKQELLKSPNAEEVKNNPKCCVLVFANKQDLRCVGRGGVNRGSSV